MRVAVSHRENGLPGFFGGFTPGQHRSQRRGIEPTELNAEDTAEAKNPNKFHPVREADASGTNPGNDESKETLKVSRLPFRDTISG